MVKGLYTSSEGMIPLMAKQDQISNNLANINTTGYKKSSLHVKTFSEFLKNDMGQPFVNDRITIDECTIDFSQGDLKQTENPLDVAIEGDGFFMVETPQGRRMTRNGNFSIDREKRLVTSNGHPLVAKTPQGKEIVIRIDGKDVLMRSDGAVVVNGNVEGFLRIVTMDKPYHLDRQGDSLYRLNSDQVRTFDSQSFKLHQGFLETSNANPVESMVEMIAIFRNYEASQKAIHAQNETLGKAVNEVGRLNV